MPENKIVLIVEVLGAHSFKDNKSLHFNVDDEVVSFTSIDKITDIEFDPGVYGSGIYVPAQNWSSKRYLIDKSFLERILNAKRVIIRIDLSKNYLEGVFSKNTPMSARPAFKRFLEKIENIYKR